MNNITDSISNASGVANRSLDGMSYGQYDIMWVVFGVLIFAIIVEYIYHKYYPNQNYGVTSSTSSNNYWQVTWIILAVLIISVGIQYISHTGNNNPI
jgi:hypothetical protein